jgi:PLP dependent protein
MSYSSLIDFCNHNNVTLVAVSKTKPAEAIAKLYKSGQRIFGENKLQEIIEKSPLLPDDIQWHFIGHLQSNKVKQLLPFVSLIHSVDSLKLAEEIQKEAYKIGKNIGVLLQIHIAQEETKYGLESEELEEILKAYNDGKLPNIIVKGLMGMASFTDNDVVVRNEFRTLKKMYDHSFSIIEAKDHFNILSMGMSGDYKLAIEEGSNMIRIGSLLFGAR